MAVAALFIVVRIEARVGAQNRWMLPRKYCGARPQPHSMPMTNYNNQHICHSRSIAKIARMGWDRVPYE